MNPDTLVVAIMPGCVVTMLSHGVSCKGIIWECTFNHRGNIPAKVAAVHRIAQQVGKLANWQLHNIVFLFSLLCSEVDCALSLCDQLLNNFELQFFWQRKHFAEAFCFSPLCTVQVTVQVDEIFWFALLRIGKVQSFVKIIFLNSVGNRRHWWII